MAIATTTQPIQTDFGNIAARGVQQVQQAQQLEEQKKEREYQKMLDLEDRYGIPEEDFSLPDTEFRTLDDITTEITSQARDRYYDVFKKLQKDPQNPELKKQLGRLKGSIGQVRATHEKFMALGEDYLAKLEADKISGVDEDDLMEKLQAVESGRYKLRFDDNDRIQVLTYDSEGKLSDTLNYKELINRNAIEKIEVDETLDKFMERIGEDNLTVAENGRLVTSNVFGARQEQAAINQINSLVGTNEASLKKNDAMADLLYQATNGAVKKRENFTEKERTQVKDWLLENVRGRYDTKTTMAGDPVALANMRLQESRNTRSEKLPSIDKIKVGIDDQGGALMRDDKVVLNYAGGIQLDPTGQGAVYDEIRINNRGQFELLGDKKVKLKGIQATENITEEEAAEKIGVDSRMITKVNNGNGTYTYYKSEPVVTKSEQDISKFANIIGVEDIDGLRNALNQKVTEKFGKENLDAFYRGEVKNKPTQEQQAQPTVITEGSPL